MKFKFSVRELSTNFFYNSNNHDFFIYDVSDLENPHNNTLLFVKNIDESLMKKLLKLKNAVIIIAENNIKEWIKEIIVLEKSNLIIKSINARLDFAKILNFIIKTQKKDQFMVKNKFYVDKCKNLFIGINVKIADNVKIGSNVKIGNNSLINPGVIINDNVKIGNDVIIRENSVIGGWGFGFERDADGIPIRLPHIGGVEIGNNVEIGALVTVASGTIKPTIVGDNTKIDDHVHVAHNCIIGKSTVICAGAKLCGSVNIGDNVWVGAGAIIMQSKKISSNAYIGMGAVVKNNIGEQIEVSGNPARPLNVLAREKIVLHRAKKFFKDKGD